MSNSGKFDKKHRGPKKSDFGGFHKYSRFILISVKIGPAPSIADLP
jgi:hypothetical protein